MSVDKDEDGGGNKGMKYSNNSKCIIIYFYLCFFGCIQLMIEINSILKLWCGIKTKIVFNLKKNILKYTDAAISFVTI